MKELLPMWLKLCEGSLALLTATGYLEVALLHGLGNRSTVFLQIDGWYVIVYVSNVKNKCVAL
jgi:hypothetical protein